MNFAKSYLDVTKHTISSIEDGALRLSYDAPIFALLAHALELQLKASLVIGGKTHSEVEGYKHNLARLYADSEKMSEPGYSINELENVVRSRWRQLLREARDNYAARLSTLLGTDDTDVFKEFGVHSNSVIGQNLPELSEQVRWLSERHAFGGSKFRYLKTGPDFYSNISEFGLNLNVPMRTVLWACEELDLMLRNKLFPK